MSQFRKTTRRSKRRQKQIVLTSAICFIVFLSAVIFILLMVPTSQTASGTDAPQSSGILHFFEPKARIPNGITIGGLDLSGLTEESAARKLKPVFPEIPEDQVITFSYGSQTLTMTAGEIGAHWDIAGSITAALNGRSKEVSFKTDRDTIQNLLNTFFAPLGGIYRPSGGWTEGPAPDLDKNDPIQMYIVFDKGSSGLTVSIEDIIDAIEESCRSRSYQYSMADDAVLKSPQPLDLSSLYSGICKEPLEPSLDHDTMMPVAGRHGYGFDISEIEAMLESSSEQLRVRAKYLEPTLTLEDVWYLDTLGAYRTPYTDNENRNNNLRLACAKLNGLILKPGESLSYNQVLGKRTKAAGYLPAPAYVGTELSDEVGGGICQVSSTLYLSSLLAELSITDRRNHGYPVDYIPLGLDATVNWGTTDLKIQNDRKYAVKVLAEAENGYVTVKIMGVEDRNYTVKYEVRVDDHPSYASAYRCRYDLETGEEIYRKLDHTSIYLEDVWCWPEYVSSNTN